MKLTKTQEYLATKLKDANLYPSTFESTKVVALPKEGSEELVEATLENGFELWNHHFNFDRIYISFPVDPRQKCINDFWDKLRDGFLAAGGGSVATFENMQLRYVVDQLAQNGFRMIYKKEWVIRE